METKHRGFCKGKNVSKRSCYKSTIKVSHEWRCQSLQRKRNRNVLLHHNTPASDVIKENVRLRGRGGRARVRKTHCRKVRVHELRSVAQYTILSRHKAKVTKLRSWRTISRRWGCSDQLSSNMWCPRFFMRWSFSRKQTKPWTTSKSQASRLTRGLENISLKSTVSCKSTSVSVVCSPLAFSRPHMHPNQRTLSTRLGLAVEPLCWCKSTVAKDVIIHMCRGCQQSCPQCSDLRKSGTTYTTAWVGTSRSVTCRVFRSHYLCAIWPWYSDTLMKEPSLCWAT